MSRRDAHCLSDCLEKKPCRTEIKAPRDLDAVCTALAETTVNVKFELKLRHAKKAKKRTMTLSQIESRWCLFLLARFGFVHNVRIQTLAASFEARWCPIRLARFGYVHTSECNMGSLTENALS
jgi:hypothetical protein